MRPEDVMDIRVTRRVDDNRLMGLPIIELEFEKTPWTHIKIGGESIQLRMKKEKKTLCGRGLQFGHPKEFCKSNMDLCRDCIEYVKCRGHA